MTSPANTSPANTPANFTANLDVLADLFRNLGQETRLRLLCLLRTGEHSVGEIDGLLAIGQPGLSQQLAILRGAGFVNTRRVAKQVYYSLNPQAFVGVAALLGTLTQSLADAEQKPPAPQPPAPQPPVPKPPRGRHSTAKFAKML